MSIIILQRLFIEGALDIIYFPVWWYTGGVKHAGQWCYNLFLAGNERLAPGLWFLNLTVPMFGQRDITGRLISFFMRFVNVVGRGLALLAWLFVCLAFLGAWLAIPLIVSYGLFRSIIAK